MAVWQDLIVCAQFDPDGISKGYDHLCQFGDLVRLANNFIQDLVIVATLVTTIVFLIAGFNLITASITGNVGALKNAQKMFKNVITGYIVILAAWIIVYTILHALVNPSYWLLSSPSTS